MKILFRVMKESVKVLLLASVLSSFGGIGLEFVRERIVTIIPLFIILPALNDMVGGFGTLVSSKVTTMFFLGKLQKEWWKSRDVFELFKIMIKVAVLCSFYIGVVSCVLALFKGFPLGAAMIFKVVFLSLVVTVSLVSVIFLSACQRVF